MVIASDFSVPNPAQVWPLLQSRRSALAGIGARHVLVYTSTRDYGRVLVTIGVRSREPIVDLLRSRVFFDWFDAVGVGDIPAVFAGEIVERFKAGAPAETAPGIVVAATASIPDVGSLVAEIRGALRRFEAAGIRETRLFRAFDDGHEVMILQELDDDERARRWIEHPDPAAPWIDGAGRGAYPPVFVGKFFDMIRIDG
ncbi:fatty-acid--CoA ligase [Candidatus Mycobacterium methanotrophicum]|uniref:Fatty-acid--CoA ligase n=1 Tax=Candidatus Mycobacterium methanotrophicum TaxID=2943498 RepID=A0ABY4QS88_9MYCO|nr:fatty-acid--CoA ligase [Candidatus Mycobacterium methanotrophicum]UQX12871.1 fatty-acid--CoA ligase [Candidatus Mycobacterium methanotrophicum]